MLKPMGDAALGYLQLSSCASTACLDCYSSIKYRGIESVIKISKWTKNVYPWEMKECSRRRMIKPISKQAVGWASRVDLPHQRPHNEKATMQAIYSSTISNNLKSGWQFARWHGPKRGCAPNLEESRGRCVVAGRCKLFSPDAGPLAGIPKVRVSFHILTSAEVMLKAIRSIKELEPVVSRH